MFPSTTCLLHMLPASLKMLFPITSLPLLLNSVSSFWLQQNYHFLREDFPEILLLYLRPHYMQVWWIPLLLVCSIYHIYKFTFIWLFKTLESISSPTPDILGSTRARTVSVFVHHWIPRILLNAWYREGSQILVKWMNEWIKDKKNETVGSRHYKGEQNRLIFCLCRAFSLVLV